MDKYIFDENNGLWYELQGDYYIPCLILYEEETQPIGLWGQRHKQYLKEHKQFIYTTMLIEGTLNRYLADINQQAEQMVHRLIKEMAEKQGVTETLIAEIGNRTTAACYCTGRGKETIPERSRAE